MSTVVRLAYSSAAPKAFEMYANHPDNSDHMPAVLVSYFYIKEFDRDAKYFAKMRDWSMDSGAFSAHNSGKSIDLQQYIDECKKRTELDPKLVEVFSLDVIGDWRASWKATETMWNQGVKAIPTFHYGEPWEVLIDMAKSFPKISIGGVVRVRAGEKKRWVDQVFSRVWPAKIHGLGIHNEQIISAVPFHSCDASNWAVGPACFGAYHSFGRIKGVRGPNVVYGIASDVASHMAMERRVQSRWRKTFEKLGW